MPVNQQEIIIKLCLLWRKWRLTIVHMSFGILINTTGLRIFII